MCVEIFDLTQFTGQIIEQLQQQAVGLMRQLTPTPPPPQQLAWLPPPLPQQTPVQLLPAPPQQQQQLPWLAVPAPAVHAPVLPAPMQLWHPWFAQSPIQPRPEPCINYDGLRELLNTPDIDETDLEQILESRDLIPTRYRSRAEQVAVTQQFRDWIVAPTSRELLVHGEYMLDGTYYASAMTLLCATMTLALRRRRDRYVSLVFFCSRHIEDDDEYTGGKAIIRSLIVQLLRQHSFDTTLLHREVNLGRVQGGDIKQLCALFGWLIRRLPRDVTVICLIDGIVHYETDRYEADMLSVLRYVLHLVRDDRLSTVVKVLATSPSATEKVQEVFREDDSCFLSMTELPRANQESSMLRLESQLDGSDNEVD
jgi:hypothetical protein